uniref:Zinc finger protein 385D n=1 Tax=Gadus morhua TaxID=8049 RepID=A0A8C4Z4Q0_GADMO
SRRLFHACQSGLLPALMRPSHPMIQPSLGGLKQFLPFPMSSASAAASLFPGFSTMDPVQKAVLHHTLGVVPTVKRKHVSCSVCQLRFNSQSQALAHYKGTKHAKKLKAHGTPKTRLKGSAVAKETAKQENAKGINTSQSPNDAERKGEELFLYQAEGEVGGETEEEKAKRLLYCSLCKVAVNSSSQLDAHNMGTKHKTMVEARTGGGSIKSYPRTGVKGKLAAAAPPTKSATGLQNKTFHCETCDVHVNSETQLKQHISSRRHKDRAAGKPAKPKYSPYSKPAKAAYPDQRVTLSVGKDLGPPLPAQIMPAHLAAVAAAAAAAMGNPFSLPALFQTQSLPAALLRPAPGPVRTSHPQMLFAPY